MNPRVIAVSPKRNYRLHLQFDNGEYRIFDVSPYLERGIFKDCPDTLYVESILPFD